MTRSSVRSPSAKAPARAAKAAQEASATVTPAAALAVLVTPAGELPALFARANALRLQHFGNRVHLCSILNAKSGACSEDCAFCAQSARHRTHAEIFPLRSTEAMVAAYEQAAALPIGHFGIVTSGGALPERGLDQVCKAVRTKKLPGKTWCASLGCLTLAQLRKLKAAGVARFHHNLETAESFFPTICSTHTYASRLATLRAARTAGLEVCCGGILGLGETLEQRVEFAFTLARERVDAIPLNFLVAIPGTRLANQPPMAPLDILRAIAMFRLVNPRVEIKVCAGRLLLRDLQSMVFFAGATGIMVGNLLTVAGRDVQQDVQMLRDLGVETDGPAG